MSDYKKKYYDDETGEWITLNTYQDSLKRVEADFKDRVENNNISMVGRVDIEVLSRLVDKTVPISPRNYDRFCGVCDHYIYDKYEKPFKENYCGNCGHKINWEELKNESNNSW